MSDNIGGPLGYVTLDRKPFYFTCESSHSYIARTMAVDVYEYTKYSMVALYHTKKPRHRPVVINISSPPDRAVETILKKHLKE